MATEASPAKTRFALALAAILLLCALVLWRLRAPRDDAGPVGAGPRAAETCVGPAIASEGPGDAKAAPRGANLRGDHWRGLRLLDSGSVPKEAAPRPHPWAGYLEMRAATFRRWDETPVSFDEDTLSLNELPGAFGTSSGLVMRIDPACVPRYPITLVETHNPNARSALERISNTFGLRLTVGVDGLIWVVPEEGLADCEPEFMPDLRRWEQALERESRNSREETVESGATRAAMREKRARVELVRVTLEQALQTLERTFGVLLEDRRSGDPPQGERVTIVQESVTLEEALREILAPLEMGTYVDGSLVELHHLSDLAELAAIEASSAKSEKAKEAARSELLARKVTLNGCPLSAEDLAAETAKQAGIPVALDPLLRTSSARWEAVEAELTVGEVLRAIEAGAGCKCRLRDSNWPDYVEGDSWKLWVFWNAPAPEKPTPR